MTKEAMINKTLESEGGYTKPITGDRGGETYCGIARNFFPKWEGWKIVDKKKPLKTNAVIKTDGLPQLVVKFYEDTFYKPSKCEQYVSDSIKMQVFDLSVNAGIKRALMTLQKAINEAYNVKISVDGVVGPTTLGYANKTDKIKELEKAYMNQRSAFYKSIGVGSKAKFLKGWLKRSKEIYEWSIK